ncbi:snoaL-like domain protein [Clostridium argentinense CDC 2741]|uniref:SnoaL-like domain protein n=1 Tax=Clostridium argentinense CDC 2741 TaxID=1418104 RepID=A0A0C1R3Y4_9CLOT|nr:hypothetical protein [Clostridium argentinense]ARC84821.1 hypothetical protein RSJ17_09955 [Clostridium argentinense]KIE48272.1 snoaL-like domain protein [Clostridium argentinense CDC 2741]NFF41134.1 hypothetical protein [Clostridium argentinense]NFP51572.1 hypothetical protein [Clostridium argentinense]NFP74063.1 hypothetical protein [Clostridium argentinense]
MRKDDKTIENIKMSLKKFQEQYNEGNAHSPEAFVKEFFIDEKDTSLVGSGLNSWCFGIENIKDEINSYWTKEEKHLKHIELDIDDAVINLEGKAAVVSISGKNTRNISEEKTYEDMINKLSKELNADNVSKGTLAKLLNEISEGIVNLNSGEKYISQEEKYIEPFRVTMVMVNTDLNWMIKHMKISFSGNGLEITLNNYNVEDKFKLIPVEKEENLEIEEIQKVLQVFQEAYDKRDVNLVDSYGDELLHKDENLFIFGTDQGENFYGFEEGKELFEGDWKYWGDFNLNKENAYISILDNIAVVYSKAIIKFTWKEDNVSKWPKLNLDYYVNKTEKSNVEIIYKILSSMANCLDIMVNDKENVFCSMKFFGVLIKKDGKWKFNHMHFSDIVE